MLLANSNFAATGKSQTKAVGIAAVSTSATREPIGVVSTIGARRMAPNSSAVASSVAWPSSVTSNVL
eukprot:scaffold101188_cov67-Phaeocystis_antarctica.AAC.4